MASPTSLFLLIFSFQGVYSWPLVGRFRELTEGGAWTGTGRASVPSSGLLCTPYSTLSLNCSIGPFGVNLSGP
jgi:hypothetical protein